MLSIREDFLSEKILHNDITEKIINCWANSINKHNFLDVIPMYALCVKSEPIHNIPENTILVNIGSPMTIDGQPVATGNFVRFLKGVDTVEVKYEKIAIFFPYDEKRWKNIATVLSKKILNMPNINVLPNMTSIKSLNITSSRSSRVAAPSSQWSIFTTEEKIKRAKKRAGDILQNITLPPESRKTFKILDIGVGDGHVSNQLALMGFDVYSIDVDNFLDPTISKNIKFTRVSHNSNKIPFDNEYFNLVICLQSLHHMDNVDLELQEISRITKLGGYLFIREHDISDRMTYWAVVLEHKLYCIVENDECDGPLKIQGMSQKEWNASITRHDFSIVKSDQPWGPTRYFNALYKKMDIKDLPKFPTSDIKSLLVKNEYPFPTICDMECVNKQFQNLKSYIPKFSKRYFEVYNIGKSELLKYEGDYWIVEVFTDYYNLYEKISDHFTGEVRAKAKRYDRQLSAWDYYWSHGKEIASYIDQHYAGNYTSETVRDALFNLHGEVAMFKPYLMNAFVEKFGAKSVLDFSSGWGDRLISAISMGIDYYGIDLNEELIPHYKQIIETLGESNFEKYHMIHGMSQTFDIGDAKVDMIFTSPPYFDLEIYFEGQSDVNGSDLDDWYEKYLMTSIVNSWRFLKDGGHMIININNVKGSPDYVLRMVRDVSSGKRQGLTDAKYLGCIGQFTVDRKGRSAQPFFIFEKFKSGDENIYQDFEKIDSFISNIPNMSKSDLKNFTKIIGHFPPHEFSRVVYAIANAGHRIRLIDQDLEYLPITRPFEDIVLKSKYSQIPYKYFDTVSESRYSSLMPWHQRDVKAVLRSEFPKLYSFVDLTAHIGVDTVFLHELYPRASSVSVEYDEETYLVLRDNLVRMSIIMDKDYEKMWAMHGDAVQIVDSGLDSLPIKSIDAAYIDPPWGGKSYMEQATMKLFLGDTNVAILVEKILSQKIPVILKTPVNIDFSDYQHLSYKKYDITTGKKVSYLLLIFK